MKAKLCILIFIVLFVGAKEADCEDLNQVRSLFHKGNASYSDGNFEQAISDYEAILNQGYESGPLYYNLGNAYFKKGLLGRAIVNYLRAKRLIPRDADLRPNVTYARSLIKGGAQQTQRGLFGRLMYKISDSLSLDTIAISASIVYVLLSVILIMFVIAKERRRYLIYAGIVVTAVLVFWIYLFSFTFTQFVIKKRAVVVTQNTDSKFEPFENATTHFTLNEGEDVIIVSQKGSWTKVERLDGKQGWLQASSLEIL